MKVINILLPLEMRGLRKQENITQQQMCLIMGMSAKSYKMIGEYEQGISDITSYHAWECLQDWMKKNNITLKEIK